MTYYLAYTDPTTLTHQFYPAPDYATGVATAFAECQKQQQAASPLEVTLVTLNDNQQIRDVIYDPKHQDHWQEKPSGAWTYDHVLLVEGETTYNADSALKTTLDQATKALTSSLGFRFLGVLEESDPIFCIKQRLYIKDEVLYLLTATLYPTLYTTHLLLKLFRFTLTPDKESDQLC